MPKLTLTTIATGYGSVDALNANFDAIETAIENTLSRDGTSPNTMSANLDMNSKRILNLPAPSNANEPARLQDVQDAVAGGSATLITFSPTGNIAATNVQAAIAELDSEKLPDASVSAFMKTVLDDATAADARTTLGAAAAATSVQAGAITGSGLTMATSRLLGRTTASTGAVEEISVGAGLTLSGGSLSASSSVVLGQCQLTKSGANLLLSPFKGNKLTINSVAETIPDAGVTLSAIGALSGTNYYIYAYMNSGTMTLEYSTTVPATQTGTGVRIKNGDATRTLVGIAQAIAGPNWADTEAQRFVRSYFNRKPQQGDKGFSMDRATTSATFVELNSEIRNEFVGFADDIVVASCGGIHRNTAATNLGFTAVGFDGTAQNLQNGVTVGGATYGPACAEGKVVLATDGYHYVTLMGRVGGGTGEWSSICRVQSTLIGPGD